VCRVGIALQGFAGGIAQARGGFIVSGMERGTLAGDEGRAPAGPRADAAMTQAKRRVLLITGAFPPTRVAEADEAFHTCAKLAARGYEVEVLTSVGAVSDPSLPFRVHPVMEHWGWRELPRLLRVAKEIAPDAVFLLFAGHIYNFHPMITLAPPLLKRGRPDLTVVTQLTCTIGCRPYLLPFSTRAAWRALISVPGAQIDYSYGRLLRDSDRVIAMANSHLQEFVRLVPQVREKSILIPPPPLLPMSAEGAESRNRGRQALGLGSEDFVFAYFGRLRSGKGLETLLEAFKLVAARHASVKLAIIGGADQDWFGGGWTPDHLHDLARTLGVTEKVVWSGEYSWDSDIGSAYLRGADVAVLPFDYGVDLNNSSFAAVAAHALPTITTMGPIRDDVFADGENVLLCPPKDPAAVAAAMERLLLDTGLRQRLRSGIEQLSRHWFSWEVGIERTIQALDAARLPA
jgi:glycosyltransferase involved in cell wall biosynthesis